MCGYFYFAKEYLKILNPRQENPASPELVTDKALQLKKQEVTTPQLEAQMEQKKMLPTRP